MKNIIIFMIGVIFGLGLIVSQMTNPAKVLNFLKFGASWDGSLIFVMAVAMAVMAAVWRWQRGQNKPVFGTEFSLSTYKQIDVRLVAGSALFGLGWGLSGICPGPGLVQLVSLKPEFILFFASIIAGMCIVKFATRLVQPVSQNCSADCQTAKGYK